MIYFLTGNLNKFQEAKAILGEVEQLEIDLPEIQGIDPKEIIKAKLLEALKHHQGPFIVEDGSLCFDCLNGLPGPLIKWFESALGNDGLAKITQKMGNNQAEAMVMIGYAKNPEEIYYFEGIIKGKIVDPSGENGFGWDKIFIPEGHSRTFAQMSSEEKNSISMRKIALEKLREFLKS